MVSFKTAKEYLYFCYYLFQGAIFLFFAGRIETLKGNIDEVSNHFVLEKVSFKSFRRIMFHFWLRLGVVLVYV